MRPVLVLALLCAALAHTPHIQNPFATGSCSSRNWNPFKQADDGSPISVNLGETRTVHYHVSFNPQVQCIVNGGFTVFFPSDTTAQGPFTPTVTLPGNPAVIVSCSTFQVTPGGSVSCSFSASYSACQCTPGQVFISASLVDNQGQTQTGDCNNLCDSCSCPQLSFPLPQCGNDCAEAFDVLDGSSSKDLGLVCCNTPPIAFTENLSGPTACGPDGQVCHTDHVILQQGSNVVAQSNDVQVCLIATCPTPPTPCCPAGTDPRCCDTQQCQVLPDDTVCAGGEDECSLRSRCENGQCIVVSGTDVSFCDFAPPENKVHICHATGSATNPFVAITVSVNAIPAHENHQDGRDIICPTD
jgi:hypothetical protein